MVKGNRRAAPLMSPVTWKPDQEIDLSFVTPIRLRYIRASIKVTQQVHDYISALSDLGIPIDDPMLERMVDAAERREREAAERENRRAEYVREPCNPPIHDPVVYYMRMDRLVKIGTSGSLRSRLASLTTQGVMAIEWGGRELERQRHAQFIDLHSHLEWFYLDGRLVEHIAELRERFEAAQRITVEQWLADQGIQ